MLANPTDNIRMETVWQHTGFCQVYIQMFHTAHLFLFCHHSSSSSVFTLNSSLTTGRNLEWLLSHEYYIHFSILSLSLTMLDMFLYFFDPDGSYCAASLHPRPKGPDTPVCLPEWSNGLHPSIIIHTRLSFLVWLYIYYFSTGFRKKSEFFYLHTKWKIVFFY